MKLVIVTPLTPGWKPKNWYDNPEKAMVLGEILQDTEDRIQEMAEGFNIAEIANPGDLWAIVTDDTFSVPAGRIVKIHHFDQLYDA